MAKTFSGSYSALLCFYYFPDGYSRARAEREGAVVWEAAEAAIVVAEVAAAAVVAEVAAFNPVTKKKREVPLTFNQWQCNVPSVLADAAS